MRPKRRKHDKPSVKKMRAALHEAGEALNATQATRAKMAEKILEKAAEDQPVSQDELRDTAMKAGKKPAP